MLTGTSTRQGYGLTPAPRLGENRAAMRGLGVLAVTALLAIGIALAGCGGDDDSGGSTQDSVEAKRWEGSFATNFGAMSLVAEGDRVTGGYDYCDGQIEGTVDGHRLTGEWTEDPQACAPDERRGPQTETSGTFDFTLSADGSSFNGNWRYASGREDPDGDDWNGERAESRFPS
jgi:hypothetical protein